MTTILTILGRGTPGPGTAGVRGLSTRAPPGTTPAAIDRSGWHRSAEPETARPHGPAARPELDPGPRLVTGVRGLYPQVAGVVRVTAGFEGDQVVVLGVAEAAGVLAGGGVGALLLAGLARFSWPVTLSGAVAVDVPAVAADRRHRVRLRHHRRSSVRRARGILQGLASLVPVAAAARSAAAAPGASPAASGHMLLAPDALLPPTLKPYGCAPGDGITKAGTEDEGAREVSHCSLSRA